jgi:hypothetical protein
MLLLQAFSSRSVRAMVFGVLISLLAWNSVRAQSWQYIAPMNHVRIWHLALILNNGKILVMGGEDGTNVLNSCELYDPSTNTWKLAASMNTPRQRFQACMLPDGRVFVAGGLTDLGNSTTNTCEIYDPVADTWRLTASMDEAREEFGLCVIPDNKIALIGGLDGNISQVVSSADIFDVATETMTTLPNQLQITCAVSAVYSKLSNSIYVAGGNQGGYGSWKLQMTQKFSLDDWQWSTVDSMINRQGAQFNTLTRPATGEIFLFTNDTAYYNLRLTTLVESMNPSTGHWQPKGNFTPRSDPRGVVIDDSAVFPGGVGASGNAISNCSWFNFRTGVSTEGSPLLEAMMHNMVLFDSLPSVSDPCSSVRRLYSIGGQDSSNNIVANCEVLDLSNNSFVSNPSNIHRESASAYFGQIDSLTLGVDVSAQINIDSLWPFITDIQATYTWDSSVVSYVSFLAPPGWGVSSISHTGNSADFDIQNISSSAISPLNLGMALFRPHYTQLGTSWVEMPSLVVDVGSKPLSLCVTDNEDNHWAVKTLGELSGVAEPEKQLADEISVYPNPAGNELFVRNTNDISTAITMYDAIGRMIAATSVPPASTTSIDIGSLSRGSYLMVCHLGDSVVTKRVNKVW